MKVTKFANTYGKLKFTISNDGLGYAIKIKYAVKNSFWIELTNEVIIYAITNDLNKYAITNDVIKYAITYDVIKCAITNDVIRYAITKDLIKY